MNETSGLHQLFKKTLAVISASVGTLLHQAEAAGPPPDFPEGKNLNVEAFQKKILRSKLVLKLNASNIHEGKVVMHTSHSSHRSHSSHSSHASSSTSGHYSHSSHASHASHYSSTPSYTPSSVPSSVPSTTPVLRSPALRIERNRSSSPLFAKPPSRTVTDTTITNSYLPYSVLGSRVLFKGCRGTDVKALQVLLIGLGYDLAADGYFGQTTRTAVLDFQNANFLTADGRVGPQTLAAIKNQ